MEDADLVLDQDDAQAAEDPLDYDGREGDKPRFGRRMIERILTRYQEFAPGEVDDMLAMLRRLAAESARTAARDILAARREGRRAA